MSDAGKLLVSRPPGGYRDLLRAYKVQVDGVQAATVKRGGRVEIAVAAGQHDVRAVLDGFGSPTLRVMVPPDGDVEMAVRPGGSPVNALWQMRRRDTYLSLTTDAFATVVPSPPYRRSKLGWVGTLLLAVIAFAGIYFFFRGVGNFEHGGSHSVGIKFLVLGLACYIGALGTGRFIRRRNRRDRPR